MACGPSRSSRSATGKQAVVVIHGMGEQIPMQTLRSFVETVWENDPTLVAPRKNEEETEVWSKPDAPGESYEMRRITTRRSKPSERHKDGLRTDFYEFYWADVMQGTTWQDFWEWLQTLLIRRRRHVPPDVRLAWYFLWLVTMVAGALSLAAVLPEDVAHYLAKIPFVSSIVALPTLVTAAAVFLIGYLTNKFLLPYLGDVARYARATPRNVARRQEIRSRGMKLLDELHRSGRYERIVIVAHSLGTMVAYDLLSFLWARYHRIYNGLAETPAQEKLEELEKFCLAAEPGDAFDVAGYRKLQRALADELASLGNPWRITDFITMGSPLTHAEFLLANQKDELERMQLERLLPKAPPVPEIAEKTGAKSIAYTLKKPVGGKAPVRILHHAAPFGAVRWTNIFDPHKAIFFGDIVSGPLKGLFGNGIVDRDVTIRQRNHIFTHTLYWTWKSCFKPDNPPEHIKILRDALNLRDDGDPIMK